MLSYKCLSCTIDCMIYCCYYGFSLPQQDFSAHSHLLLIQTQCICLWRLQDTKRLKEAAPTCSRRRKRRTWPWLRKRLSNFCFSILCLNKNTHKRPLRYLCSKAAQAYNRQFETVDMLLPFNTIACDIFPLIGESLIFKSMVLLNCQRAPTQIPYMVAKVILHACADAGHISV